MILVNKTLMTTLKYPYPMVLLLFQCVCSLGLLSVANVAGLIPRFGFRLERQNILTWLPVNVFYLDADDGIFQSQISQRAYDNYLQKCE